MSTLYTSLEGVLGSGYSNIGIDDTSSLEVLEWKFSSRTFSSGGGAVCLHGTIRPVDILKDLNPQQKQAVTAGVGPVLVLAGPGSGKTRVLTHRIAYVVNNLGIKPYHILAVTFTNKAARVMESRVEKLLEESVKGSG